MTILMRLMIKICKDRSITPRIDMNRGLNRLTQCYLLRYAFAATNFWSWENHVSYFLLYNFPAFNWIRVLHSVFVVFSVSLIPEIMDCPSSYVSFAVSLSFLSVLSITSTGVMPGTGDLAVMKPISIDRPYGINILQWIPSDLSKLRDSCEYGSVRWTKWWNDMKSSRCITIKYLKNH